MREHHIYLTRDLVAGNEFGLPDNGHTFPFAHLKPYTNDSNQSPQGESIIIYGDIP